MKQVEVKVKKEKKLSQLASSQKFLSHRRLIDLASFRA
jgi:hypothetical protein